MGSMDGREGVFKTAHNEYGARWDGLQPGRRYRFHVKVWETVEDRDIPSRGSLAFSKDICQAEWQAAGGAPAAFPDGIGVVRPPLGGTTITVVSSPRRPMQIRIDLVDEGGDASGQPFECSVRGVRHLLLEAYP